MHIREIQQKDDAALFQLVRQSLTAAQLNIPGTAYFDESIKAMSQFYLNQPQRKYFVLVDQDDLVLGGAGFAEYNGSSEVAEVQKLYLFDKAKGKGYSYQLMGLVEQEAKKMGYKQLYLETHSNLPIAIILYKKLGYTQISAALPGTHHTTMDHFFVKKL
mgnify:CR=1 FL=1